MKTRARNSDFLAALVLSLVLGAAFIGANPATAAATDVTEANVTRLTAGLLGGSQFAHHPLDDKLASALLDRYLDALDGDHSLFLQADVAEFAAGQADIAQAIRRHGDTRIAYTIFARYLQRLEQRVRFIDQALRTESFDFTGDDVYSLDREQAPRPADTAAAQDLWRQRLRVEYLQEKLDGKTATQIAESLRRRAERQLRTTKQLGDDAVLEIYLSALAQVYDPHSDYLGHEQLGEFNIAMNLSLVGIGARLQSEDGRAKIIELIPGGPAARSGLLDAGDRIVAVGQAGGEPADIVDLPLSQAVNLIRGPKGTVVDLTVIPVSAGDDSVRKKVSLVRDEIKLEDRRAKSTIIDMPNGDGTTLRIGVIDLPSFYAGTGSARGDGSAGTAPPTSATADVGLLLEKFAAEKVQGVVLDLRQNGGGSLDEAIDLTGLFITTGPVVQTRGPRGSVDIGADTDPSVAYAGPLVVLTSHFSASASEILAGALQDYGRAVLVGDPSTYGKGTVQSVLRLAPIMDKAGLAYEHDPGALTVTIRKFYRPSGASTQLKGVVPDIVLPSLTARGDVGESLLENPLPWDTVRAADFERLNMVRRHLQTLRELSARRVASGVEFAYLGAEMARLKQKITTNSVSLNEAERRRELADFESRRKAHEAALEMLEISTPVSYAVTVQDALRPGLPAPSALRAEAVASAANLATETGVIDGGPEAGERSPERDAVLNEAQQILLDYIRLLMHDPVSRPGTVQARAELTTGSPAAERSATR